ncbi:MAG: hypothetical protein J5I93_22925 [Pirellulaceae bacterium]|nr:hypothetical protein [Pirellulaceae bacterium]
MPNHENLWMTNEEMEVVAAFLPRDVRTDQQKIDALLELLASGFEGDPDLDLVRDSTLHNLLRFPRLPDRTIEIMLAILADEDDSDLALTRKMAACDVLGHMGVRANPAAALYDLLTLADSDRDVERWLALRAAKAVWQITGNSAPALEVAEKLSEDDQFWLVIHATAMLSEIAAEGE